MNDTMETLERSGACSLSMMLPIHGPLRAKCPFLDTPMNDSLSCWEQSAYFGCRCDLIKRMRSC